MTPNIHQLRFLKELEGTSSNLLVEAVAGSGKTTTLKMGYDLLSASQKIVYCAFNQSTAQTMKERGIDSARTLHSLGLEILKANFPQLSRFGAINQLKVLNQLKYGICKMGKDSKPSKEMVDFFWEFNKLLTDTISLAKNLALSPKESLHSQRIDYWLRLYSLDYPLEQNYREILEQLWRETTAYYNTIDFDDMIYLPAVLPLPIQKQGIGFIDEVQDLNHAQHLLVEKLFTRVVGVGDSFQSIYAFRGADPDSMRKFKERFSCLSLPLSTCYRCGSKIVELAQTINQDISSPEGINEGQIVHIDRENLISAIQNKAERDTFILCRTLTPIISLYLELYKEKIPAKLISNRFIEELSSLAKKVTWGGKSELSQVSIDKYKKKKEEQLARFPHLLLSLSEKLDILSILMHESKQLSLPPFLLWLETVFKEQESTIKLMTIHTSKGLEAEVVFLLRPDLLPHPRAVSELELRQERNMKYVAYTRAMKELIFVEGEE